MISTNSFNIYNASAGTGKTFSLVRDYLCLLLNSNNYELYKNILAITFTNKAVNEMKGRIVKYLISYSSSVDTDLIMLKEISKKTGLSKKEIFLKSSIILKNLLKNYSAFEISTIDKLTQKIVRNFTYELGIDSKYEVEIDQNEIINRAVDNLISKIELNDDSFKNIINFSYEKTLNDKSWDITNDLHDIAQLIFDENNFSELESLKEYSLKDFERWKKELKLKIKNCDSNAKKVGNKVLKLFENEKICIESFKKTITRHFTKISLGDFNNLYKNQIEKNLIEGRLHLSTATEKDKISIEKIRGDLLKNYRVCKKIIFKKKLFENILNNISPLSILSEIKKEIESLKKEENFILISEFNKLVNEEIKNQPAPFIYEKIGTKFSHFFIDEFQDTSKMQWDNLKPLIENSLASEHSTLTLAGDPKQSIYRWRGGDVEEFMNLLSKESPFFCDKNIINLNTNYRSSKEIVNFNNLLFKHISELYADNSDLVEILNFPKQNYSDAEKGYLSLNFYEKNNNTDIEEFYNVQTLSKINDIIKRGYSYKDICIIVRKKKEGVKIGDYLTQNNIPIISSEVLNLSSSPDIILILNLIRFHIDPSDFNKINLCKSFCELNFINQPKEDFLIDILEKSFDDIKKYITIDDFNIDLKHLNRVSMYEALEYIIDEFKIMKDGNAYIQFFLDFAHEYTNKFQTGLNEFVEYFEEKKEKLNIINPQGVDAIEIITIHKSKGLEFPVVIYPYADINIYGDLNPKTWINIDDKSDVGFKKSLINVNKDLEKIDKELFSKYRGKLEIDNINLLYVVLTRAQKELYILTNKNTDTKGDEKINFYSGIFISYLKKINAWNNSKFSYDFGSKSLNKTEVKPSKNLIQNHISINSRVKQNIIISSKNSSSWLNDFEYAKEEGNVFHQIMEEISSEKDVAITLNKFYDLGVIDDRQKEEYKRNILAIINHDDLNKYFNEEVISFNEREIISKSGAILVPDRLVFLNNSEVTIIDYKTGSESLSHINQLNKYEGALQEMNVKVAEKILIYIGKKIKIKYCK